jgi:hypothetical protein
MSRGISLRVALLDNQIVDRDRLPIGRVDDVEIEVGEGLPRVTAVLTGSEALGPRLGGSVGWAMAALSARLRDPHQDEGPARIEIGAVKELEPLVELDLAKDEMPEVAGLERWLARQFVARLPGSGR